MIQPTDRKIVLLLLRLKIWRVEISMWRVPEIRTRWGTRWIYNQMLRRQTPDDLHHAPCCPANHWTRCRLVFHNCNCGAAQYEREKNEYDKN